MMQLAHYQKLQALGVPAPLLGRLAVAPLSPSLLPAPPRTSFPAAKLPLGAVAAPSKEPPRQSSFTDLAPAFSLRLWLALRDANKDGLNVALFEGLRTGNRQAWLYAGGRTRSGSRVTNASTVLGSWHGFGLAGDVAFINSKGNWNWPSDDSLWRRWLTHAQKFGLTTGIDWTNPVDAPHTQPKFLQKSPQPIDRQLVSTGGLIAVWEKYDQMDISESLFALI